ncbi:major facilitator superfamily domain-containing protein [Dendryphion nanum]|uniref:Major facilitator superfamily domain-containing protein n=1 Tax=Dendryphion nanum TaxID=256645 RepID=A0A9P9DC80_9PLEO|nr:major facilitator superfamily domain-containing protein [Dendryphion nanum]
MATAGAREKNDGSGSSPALKPDSAQDAERSRSLVEELADEGTNLYEKKCVLVNREIDMMGMGKYQWYLWTLCGLGYMIDLTGAWLWRDQTGNLSTAFSAGLTAGAFVWGVLADIIGRQWAFNLTVFVSSIFGLCLAIPDSYSAILVLTAFVGFGVGGNIPIDTTITLEFTPQNRRYLLPLLSVFQPIGVVICSVVAYGFIPNYSCSPNFSEPNPLSACSVVFLLYRGKDARAIEVLHHIAKQNGGECSLTLDMLQALEKQYPTSSTPVLGSGTQQPQIAGFYLPQIIALKNGALNKSLRYTYRSYVYIYLPGIIGVLLGAALYRTSLLGHKYTMMLSTSLMAVSIFVFSTVNSPASNIGLNLMEYFFQSMFNAVLYGWTPEAFPAPIRGTACGLASFWGRLFGIVSPLIAQHLYARDEGKDINGVLYLAGGVTLGCVITVGLIPGRVMGRQSL